MDRLNPNFSPTSYSNGRYCTASFVALLQLPSMYQIGGYTRGVLPVTTLSRGTAVSRVAATPRTRDSRGSRKPHRQRNLSRFATKAGGKIGLIDQLSPAGGVKRS